MDAVLKGKLVVQKTRKGPQLKVSFPSKKGMSSPTSYAPGELSADLAAQPPDKLDGIEVDLELEKGLPKRIRKSGEIWKPPRTSSTSSGVGQPARSARGVSRISRPVQDSGPRFHNPYTFVLTPDRKGVLENPLSHQAIAERDDTADQTRRAFVFAGDHNPVEGKWEENHSRLWPGRFSGTLPLKLTVVTPVFITKTPAVQEGEDGHCRYDCCEEVPATALKGMLRSAYEAITNSRLGVFSKEFKEPLGLRKAARANLVPGRVQFRNGAWTVTLYLGTSSIGANGQSNGPLYAAWVPAHGGGHVPPLPNIPESGAQVSATLALCCHRRGQHDEWKFWRVVGINPPSTIAASTLSPPRPNSRWRYESQSGAPVTRQVQGFIVSTGKMIATKHDERLFFGSAPTPLVIPANAIQKYNSLLADYRRVHESGGSSDRYPAVAPCRHGAHIVQPDKELTDGDFVYVDLSSPQTNHRSVKALYPVQISRDLYLESPEDCLPPSLRPAENLFDLSPADRLFGWVRQNGSGAWRGKVRLTSVRVNHPQGDPLIRFTDSRGTAATVPLSILGAPKPSQTRFYLGTERGEAQPPGLSKEDAGYMAPKKIRGRKFYWHQSQLSDAADYWNNPWEDRTSVDYHGFRQEYRQPSRARAFERTNQNRSITGWLRPGTEIRFSLSVENLTAEELGAILKLCRLHDGCCLKIGLGKPLGLGSVRFSADDLRNVQIALSERWADYYSDVSQKPDEVSWATPDELDKSITVYEQVMITAFGDSRGTWGELPFIKGFLGAAHGPRTSSPIRYPRLTNERTRVGTGGDELVPSYEWFVRNEKSNRGVVAGLCLPNVDEDEGLPIDPFV